MNVGNEEGNPFLVKCGRFALYYRKGKQVSFVSVEPIAHWEENRKGVES